MCAAIKPLTPLAAINTIATHILPSIFLVGYTALLTSLTPGAEGKHREQLISQGLLSPVLWWGLLSIALHQAHTLLGDAEQK